MLEYLDTVKEFQSTLLMRGATRRPRRMAGPFL